MEKIKTINKQIKLIEKLVNEFSDVEQNLFLNELNKIIKDTVNLMKTNDKNITINFNPEEVHM